MLFSHDNNVVTILFGHHCCNNLLTSWKKHVNNREHGCSINKHFPCFQQLWTTLLLHHYSTILLKQCRTILLVHDNIVVQSLFRQQLCNNLWDITCLVFRKLWFRFPFGIIDFSWVATTCIANMKTLLKHCLLVLDSNEFYLFVCRSELFSVMVLLNTTKIFQRLN